MGVPVNVSAGMVSEAPANKGTDAGQLTVSAGTVPALPVKTWVCVARADPVKTWVCVPRAEPAKVGAGWVCVEAASFVPDPAVTTFAAVAEAAIAETVPAGVPALTEAFVPAGVPAVMAALVPAGVKLAVEFVGTEAGHAIVPAGVAEVALFVPLGVIVAFPPVVPTFEFAATVPRTNFPLKAETSVKPVGQAAERVSIIMPLGTWAPMPDGSADIGKRPLVSAFAGMLCAKTTAQDIPTNRNSRLKLRTRKLFNGDIEAIFRSRRGARFIQIDRGIRLDMNNNRYVGSFI